MIDDHGTRDGKLKFLEMCEITSRRVVCAAIKKISSCGKESEQRHLSSCALPPLLQTRDISPACNRLGFFSRFLILSGSRNASLLS